MKRLLAGLSLVVLAHSAVAQSPAAKKPFNHESEASIVTVSGNSTAETYAAKQKTSYTFEASSLIGTAAYLDGKSTQIDKTTGVSTSTQTRKWDATLRYEFAFTEKIAAFVAHGAESDPNAGYIQRDNTDLGGKYTILNSDGRKLDSELGYRYSKTYTGTNEYTNFARLYLEYNQAISETSSFKLWVEHLPNLKDSNKYLTNAEASLSVVLSTLFSLKTSYLAKYHNFQASTPTYEDKRLDSTFTTALVAKF